MSTNPYSHIQCSRWKCCSMLPCGWLCHRQASPLGVLHSGAAPLPTHEATVLAAIQQHLPAIMRYIPEARNTTFTLPRKQERLQIWW